MTLEQAYNLAMSHHVAGRIDPALEIYQQILEVFPQHHDAMLYAGVILNQKGFHADGERLIRGSIALNPNNPAAFGNLGLALHSMGRLEEAIECITQSIRMSPGIPENYNNIGNVYRDQGRNIEAREVYTHAIRLKNDYADAWNNLGAATHDIGNIDEAINCYRRGIELSPNLPTAFNNLGNAYKDNGRLKEAVEMFRQALRLKPYYPESASDLILSIQYNQDYDDWMIKKELQAWSDAIAKPFFSLIKPHDNDPNPDRVLKVGFVSPDFRMHPVGRLFVPLLKNLDPARIESVCYYNHYANDHVTQICRKYARQWINVKSMTDDELAERIRQDRIDILVDLASHTASNRLGVFARKPAPVQATWLAYCGSTGLETIDYRLSDPLLDPPDSDLTRYVEKTEYLTSYWCYPEHIGVSEPGPSPFLRNGYVTFGCLNNFCKISPNTRAAWRRLLSTLPQSKLLLFGFEGSSRDALRSDIAGEGVDPSRIDFVKRSDFTDYILNYVNIDIALDPFPYNGGTTSCDAMWMGVPVISLVGARAVNRAGLSVLTQVGLPELAAYSVDEYIQKAVDLANDKARLSEIRSTLRNRMFKSPLMDAQRFTRDMENAFRNMWKRWRPD